ENHCGLQNIWTVLCKNAAQIIRVTGSAILLVERFDARQHILRSQRTRVLREPADSCGAFARARTSRSARCACRATAASPPTTTLRHQRTTQRKRADHRHKQCEFLFHKVAASWRIAKVDYKSSLFEAQHAPKRRRARIYACW